MEIENIVEGKSEDFVCENCGILSKEEVKHVEGQGAVEDEDWNFCKACGREVGKFDCNQPY